MTEVDIIAKAVDSDRQCNSKQDFGNTNETKS
jgi:hypothetical protein